MSTDNIIEVNGLYKRYGLPPFLPWRKRQVQDHEWALRDINFTVPRGGSLGILGRNGAGKSTLLKVLAGVTPPDKGSVKVNGTIFPMIELTAGMSMELSGRENVKILGTIMGLSSREINHIIPKVEEFSELEDWFYRPVWQYSSGMIGRLAFGIAVNMRADVLLVDEVLSTGDIMFQKKCMSTMYNILENGTTLIFVSHSPAAVTRICENGIMLEHGKLAFSGTSLEALDAYYADLGIAGDTKRKFLPEDQRQGSGDIRINSIEILNAEGIEIESPQTGQPVTFKLNYTAKCPVRGYAIAVVIKNSRDEVLVYANTAKADIPTEIAHGSGYILYTIKNLPLLEKGLSLTVKVKGDIVFDIVENALSFDMRCPYGLISSDARTGIVHCDTLWRIHHDA